MQAPTGQCFTSPSISCGPRHCSLIDQSRDRGHRARLECRLWPRPTRLGQQAANGGEYGAAPTWADTSRRIVQVARGCRTGAGQDILLVSENEPEKGQVRGTPVSSLNRRLSSAVFSTSEDRQHRQVAEVDATSAAKDTAKSASVAITAACFLFYICIGVLPSDSDGDN